MKGATAERMVSTSLTADIENVSRRVVGNMLKNLEEKEKFQI